MNIKNSIRLVIAEAAQINQEEISVEHPEVEEFGEYSTNIALVLKGGKKLAEKIAAKIEKNELIDSVNVDGPGFINIRMKNEFLVGILNEIESLTNKFGSGEVLKGKKIMVEFAHPNTHKELHIGHMRTLITGEAVARILSFEGAEVFRANYQGDIGPHVAKAIWGTEKILCERGLGWEDADKLNNAQKAHLLGEGYVRGNTDYDQNKSEIDTLNIKIYAHDQEVAPVYELTRRWSLNYYDTFYNRFGTKFDKLYFESGMANHGKKIVTENVGRVFEVSDGAIIFDGAKYGLHKRVFVTTDGNPTYEGKEMALAYAQIADFAFDKVVHVVANEQKGYFDVVIKVLEILDKQFEGREFHLSMGMVNLVGRKMSSRTGEILTVDGLLDEVRSLLPIKVDDEDISEAVTIGAVKYSVLKPQPTMNVAFDIKQSVSLEGNSGPYLQYTFARTQSVLSKSQISNSKFQTGAKLQIQNLSLNKEELAVLRWIYRFPEVVEDAAKRFSPNLVCSYLYELAQRFNSFYNQHSILSADNSDLIVFRLKLTNAVGQVLKNGLELLGIAALERM
jgi:arginyl-tRNA synthetase